MLHSRFINTVGVRGTNIPLDLHQEHLNKLCKSCVKVLGANKAEKSMVRCGNALGVLHDVLECFNNENNVTTPSGSHHQPSYTEDVKLVIGELQRNNVFNIDGRKHSHCRKTRLVTC